MSSGSCNIIEIGSIFSNKFVEDGFSSTELVEKKEKIDLSFAEIKTQNWWFDGIRIGYTDMRFKEDQEFEWKGDLDVVTLIFNLRGRISSDVSIYGNDTVLGNYQHNVVYDANSKGKIRNHDLCIVNFMVQYTVSAFLKATAGATGMLKQFADKVSNGESGSLSGSNLYLDGRMLSVIDAIINCNCSHEVKKMFFYAKCLELLALQTDACNNLLAASTAYIKTDYDKERILFAREYLLQHMECPLTIPELSRLAGINEFKLKKGFKEMFGNTVFGYLSDARLEIAKNELLEKKKTIGEIALELGYSSTQHFSNAFRKKFCFPPGKFRS
jgi:AraC-like DNA-binding protein